MDLGLAQCIMGGKRRRVFDHGRCRMLADRRPRKTSSPDFGFGPTCPKVPPARSARRLGRQASMQRKVMISCAVTGSADAPGKNPAVPVTPEQIAASCIDAAKAGAAIVHIHVRDPKTTKPRMDGAHYREVVERIRSSGTDVLINLTTGPAARFVHDPDDPTKAGPASTLRGPQERVRHVVELRPEICSLDMGS